MPTRILLVDDEPDLEALILRKFRRQIRDNEVSFDFARNGEEALAKLRQDPAIAIVFSDINMPVMDGLTLLMQVPQLGRTVKVVMVSAYDDMSNIRTAMNRGAFDFLTKPIDFQDFEVTLAKTAAAVSDIHAADLRHRELRDLQNELAIAGRIQRDILPRGFLQDARYEIYAQTLPARTVGGDFYDFAALDSRRVAFTIGDVSGKGIPAAIFMAVCRTLLRALAAKHESPRDCLLEMNRVLLREGSNGMFVTLCHGVFDAESGVAEFCTAGQPQPFQIPAQGVATKLWGTGNMIGLLEEPEIETERVRLEPGGTLFFYTDGVPDAEDAQGNGFSQMRLAEALRGSQKSARETVDLVMSKVDEFSRGAARADDITALAIRFQG